MRQPAELIHGPVLIGTLFNVLLFGIMITQSYIYYTTYRRDRMWMKLLVLVVFIIDTLNTVFDVISIYESVIVHFGDLQSLQKTTWYGAADPVTTGVIQMVVQSFFAWRVFVLTRSWALVIVVALLSITGGVGAIIATYELVIRPEYSQLHEYRDVIIVWLAGASAADITITSILVWYLQRHKTGFRRSDMVVDRIIRISMQTGLLTSMAAIVDLILYLTDPAATHLIFNLTLCKLYSNSLISTLNSRGGWKYPDDPPHDEMLTTRSVVFRVFPERTEVDGEINLDHTSTGAAIKPVPLDDAVHPDPGARPATAHAESSNV